MSGLWILAVAVALVLLVGWLHARRREEHREAVRTRRIDERSRQLLLEHVPVFRRLPEGHRDKLEGLTQVFLDEISFEPCGGLREVTEEMKLVIGVQACLLLLESGYEDFGRLRSVLIYPDAFRAPEETGRTGVLLGESWQTGSVVISWESVVQGARNPRDGHNVVLHEFAHQLDQATGEADGLPHLKSRGDYRNWGEAFSEAYDELCARVNRSQRTVMDAYGATNPAEFFAVATETFFEKAGQLREDHRALYAELKRFYGLDPAEW